MDKSLLPISYSHPHTEGGLTPKILYSIPGMLVFFLVLDYLQKHITTSEGDITMEVSVTPI
jgi:hypothetical protein